MKNGNRYEWRRISGLALAVALLVGCGGGDDPVPVPADAGGGGGGGGGGASLTCNTSIVPGGTTPTAAQLTAFAKTYQGEEGRYSADFTTFTVEDPDADLVFAANGAATYNGSALTVTSACHEVLPGGAGEMLVIYVGTNVHFDMFSDGALAGIAPNGKAVRSPGG